MHGRKNIKLIFIFNTAMITSEITGKTTLISPPFGDLSILAISPVILLSHCI
jgi:hypothetical protein